ncbi:hypothetical protein KY334_07045 [Candidatus Woesearchaeota archaeon]|nr:hypothetical protein [Candidatus Woesearchaeota archaeon]
MSKQRKLLHIIDKRILNQLHIDSTYPNDATGCGYKKNEDGSFTVWNYVTPYSQEPRRYTIPASAAVEEDLR